MLTEQRVLAALSLIFLAVAVPLSLREREPPPLRESASEPGSAAPLEFSVGRALDELKIVAKEPHPMASAAHRVVREYLLQRLGALGLEVVVDEGFASTDPLDPASANLDYVRNVVARIPGTDGTRAVLVAAHYDSVPTGPGAGDDGAAVAAMLETARALMARGMPPRNDVIFLFTDGEEVALLGARRYVKSGPWREKVAAVLNFEARGGAGPSILFESSSVNSRLVETFAEQTRDPVASSLAYEVYRLMPNDTDFTVFRGAGWKGLNFAFIGAHDHYHTSLDTWDALDARSLQHHGEHMLALASDLADADLGAITADEGRSVFFSVLRAFTVRYPVWLGQLLVVAALLVVFHAVRTGIRSGRLGRVSLRTGILAQLGAIGAGAGASAILTRLLTSSGSDEREVFWLVVNDGPLHQPAHWLLAISLFTFILLQARTKARADGLIAGGLLVQCVLMIAVAIIAPAATYAWTWPVLASGFGLLVYLKRPRKSRVGFARFAVVTLATLPAIVLLAPLVDFSAQALTFGAAAASTACCVLAASYATPLWLAAMAVRRLAIPIVTLAAAFGMLGYAIWNGKLGVEHPRTATVEYVLDSDRTEAHLVGAAAEHLTDGFQALAVEEVAASAVYPTSSTAKRWRAVVAPTALEGANVTVTSAVMDADTRIVELLVIPPRDSNRCIVRVDPESRAWIESVEGIESAPDRRAALRTRALDVSEHAAKRRTAIGVRLHGCPDAGVRIRIGLPAGVPLSGALLDRSYGLPSMPERTAPRRPWMIPAFRPSDETVVFRRFTF